MNGRRDLPRARQGARRVELDQRDDLPARQPARLRALGGRSRASTSWDYAHCLPYFKRMETCLAGADEWRGGDGPLQSRARPGRRPAVRRVLRRRAAGGLPADRRRQRLPAGGLRDVRPQHPQRPPPESRRARTCIPAMKRPNLEVRTRTLVERVVFEGTRAVGVQVGRRDDPRRRGDPLRRRDQLAAAAAALGRRRRRRAGALGMRVVARSARGRREPAGPPRGLRPVRVEAAGDGRAVLQVAQPAARRARSGCSSSRAPARRTTSRRAGSSARTTTVAYPNVMFHFLPIAVRYDGTAPQGHGYQLHVGPMYSDARGSVRITLDRSARASGAALQLPLDRAGPARVGRVRARARARSSTQPAFGPFNGGELSPGPSVDDATRRSSTGSRATPRRRCIRRAPARWAGRSSIRRRCASTASTALRVVDASVFPFVTERQHLCAGDDGRRDAPPT